MTNIGYLILQTLAAAAGTVGFSLLFGVPVRYFCHCGLIGGAGWFLYLLTLPATTSAVATFAATVLVILMSRWFAVRKQCPVTIFLISGILPLVPGLASTGPPTMPLPVIWPKPLTQALLH